MKIVLVGYMGVGKTSLAKKIAKKVGISCYDLDAVIEKSENSTVELIFKNKGEVYFRNVEHQLFKDFLEKEEDFILSLGGGTPCYANNHLLLQRDDVVSVYLKASITTLVTKLKDKRDKRPLIKDLSQEDLHEYIAKHLFDRSFYYQNAKSTVNVDGKKKKEIVKEILQLI
ncbi:shikimate kinase [uncultured Flavobacterium sp.]|uniref:shikimate kinase n=1 Tax=uncultured Flavobacterium sp. TaxID=165435 RepID=UPI0030C7C48D